MRVNGVDFNQAFARSMGEEEYVRHMQATPFFPNESDRAEWFAKAWRILNGKPEEKPKNRKVKATEEGAE